MAGSVRTPISDFVKPADPRTFQTGLLAPNGRFYPCWYEEHDELATHHGYASAWHARDKGWIHVFAGQFKLLDKQVATQDQLDAIFDWTMAAPGRMVPEWY